MGSNHSIGFWGGMLDRISSFLPTSIKGGTEHATYTAGLFGLCVILLAFGAAIILVAPFLRDSVTGGVSTFVVTSLSALMCLAVGAILGLLFGIPRYSKLNDVESAVAPNNNLEQISDWLTKMIVGISLVQFDAIADRGKSLALQVDTAMTGCKTGCDNYAMGLAVIGFFAAAGFLMMYLWARLYLLLDVGAVQEKIDRAAAEFRELLRKPDRIQGKERHPDLGDKVEAAGAKAGFAAAERIVPGNDVDDPWKGVFGSKSRDEERGREVIAIVRPLAQNNEYCSVRLIVQSTDGLRHPLEGEVRFFLHDTFPQPIQSVEARNNRAELEVAAWGAFTVGVLSDQGATRLELDLSTVKDAPADWRGR
jgi:hypothetical protein